ncbi:branched-chain amino acid ABC transporter permease [Planktomarina temperata]|jgi:branched-chain amino acid transport system permease protein|nr:branched-chain amino acid ABC transporter permease [Planktomarina temperata]MDA9331760.1 branched-chain amino acid ABC transporter permease [bacterium]MDA8684663.1 branched-chain amino acid ABC transporter permease [Planktomarina temperata]MDA8713914.1 branched-chain amino acid ABC transporter permease [Planktomarina temperata]MDA8883740.1 branched-chain amino acid ABC transporter permease [Planktomarina temperata]
MKASTVQELIIAAILAFLAALWPLVVDIYWLGIGVDVMMYVALATSWVLFSGPTHYISLATAAFFGIGGFLVGSGMSDYEASFWSMAALSACVGAVLAALIGLATLRLSGVYFVIFTLGLAEMIRNLVSWIQNNFLGSRGLYVFTDFTDKHLYWMLLGVAVAVYLLGWIISRSRLGFALRIIGGDETVARHVGIDTATVKVILFTTTGFFAALVGAIIAPRWSYIEPNQVFSPQLSFFVVIMALLGGAGRLWGPVVGVIPFLLIWNWVDTNFPNQSILVLGIAFLVIVYFLPHGVVGRLEQLRIWSRTLK